MLAGPITAAPPLAKRVPAGTLAYIGWAGTKSPGFARSTFGQLLNEPAFGKILAAIKKAALSDMHGADEKKAFSHFWPMLGLVAQRPIAVAWTGLHETRREPVPLGAILIDLGNDRPVFAKHLDALLAMAEAEGADFAKATVGSVTYRTIKEGNDPPVSFGYIGNVFFVSLGPGAAADFITVKPSTCLQADKAFAARMREVGGDGEQFSMYLDVTAINKVVTPLIAAEMGPGRGPTPAQIFGLMGLDGVQAVAAASRFVKGGVASRTKIFSPAPHRGLLALFDGKPLTKADLSHVPADADFVCAANVSPARVWNEIRTAVRSAEPRAEQEMLEGMAQIEKVLGLSIEKDILGTMGDTWVVSSAASQGGFLTGTVVTIDLKDARAFGVAVGKIEAFFEAMLANQAKEAARPTYTCARHPYVRQGGPGVCPECEMKLVEARRRRRPKSQPSIETVKAGETDVRYVALPVGPVPVAPAWTVHKGRFYMALFPQVIQATIDNDGAAPLTSVPAFAALRAKVSKNASMLSYVNTPKIVGKFYNLALLFWTAAANAGAEESGIPLKPDWLPALSKIGKYLPPAVSAVSADKTGILIEEHAATPMPGVLGRLVTTSLGVAILAPTLTRVTHDAKRARSTANLSSIGKSMLGYRAEHDSFPDDLPTLARDYGLHSGIFVSPASGRRPPRLTKQGFQGGVDYVYVKPSKQRPDPTSVLAYERPENYRGRGTVVLFGDCSVRWLDMPEFRRALARSGTEIKAARNDF